MNDSFIQMEVLNPQLKFQIYTIKFQHAAEQIAEH